MSFKGLKYDAQMTVTQISKAIREDIKGAIRAGLLPEMKVSVRKDRNSVSVSVSEVPFQCWFMGKDYLDRDEIRLTKQGVELQAILRDIVFAYNRDDSDSMTDYFSTNFYHRIDIENDLREQRTETKPVVAEVSEYEQCLKAAGFI